MAPVTRMLPVQRSVAVRPSRGASICVHAVQTANQLRVPASVSLENLHPLPLNTHGIGKAGKEPPFIGKVSIQTLYGDYSKVVASAQQQ